MMTAVRGIYRNGGVELLERPAGVSESRVVVTFLDESGDGGDAGTAQPRQDPRPIWEIIAERARSIPAEELDRLPHDMSLQVDHYVYGVPKKP